MAHKGLDITGLGRWTWEKLTGRQGITVRIVNGYRPVADSPNKAGTVLSQHQKYFQDDGNAREPRHAFLDNLGTAIAAWKDEAQEKVTHNAFKSKTAFRHINQVLQKKERTTITFVESTDMYSVLHESMDNDMNYRACSQEGIARYGQCTDTPFMQSPLRDDFGYLGNQEAINKVLEGSYQCPADAPEYVKHSSQN
jgi:hypothetical protein